jgi:murein DD-endopeptidase MepM/ murein hydrolase activator NlpD
LRSNDLRALGRLGQPLNVGSGRPRHRLATRRAGSATVATRRPLVPRPVLVAVLVVVVALTYLGAAAAGQVDELDQLANQVAVAAPGSAGAAGAAVEDDDGPRREGSTVARSARATDEARFAEVDGMAVHLLAHDVVAVAFHEATMPEALPLDPVGVLEANDNPTKFTAPADAEGPPYRVLSSRGRGRPATSAVDIVLPDGTMAFAPVTGEVVEVRQYALYGGTNDWRVVIRPDARPDLHVVMIHLHRPQVQPGDRVVAGSDAIGLARLLPFASHVDYALEGRHPHVHLEVKAATAPPPLDPNAPAIPAEDLSEVVG